MDRVVRPDERAPEATGTALPRAAAPPDRSAQFATAQLSSAGRDGIDHDAARPPPIPAPAAPAPAPPAPAAPAPPVTTALSDPRARPAVPEDAAPIPEGIVGRHEGPRRRWTGALYGPSAPPRSDDRRATAGAPDVTVTIGRIELVAPAPAPRTPAPRTTAPAPTPRQPPAHLTLAAYTAGRKAR